MSRLGHFVSRTRVIFTVRLLRGSRTATEEKPLASWIPNRKPAAGVPEREDFLGEGLVSVDDGELWRRRDAAGSGRPRSGVAIDLDGGKGGGCLGGRRRRFDAERSGQLRLRLVAKAGGRFRFDPIGLGGDRVGGLFDLVDQNCPRDQKIDHETDCAGHGAIAVLPTADMSATDSEQFGDAVLWEAELLEGRAKFSHGRGARASPPEAKHAVKFWRG